MASSKNRFNRIIHVQYNCSCTAVVRSSTVCTGTVQLYLLRIVVPTPIFWWFGVTELWYFFPGRINGSLEALLPGNLTQGHVAKAQKKVRNSKNHDCFFAIIIILFDYLGCFLSDSIIPGIIS